MSSRSFLCDLGVEVLDHSHGGKHAGAPRLRELETAEQLATGATEQIRHGAGVTERQQLGVHAVLERGALAHQKQAPAGALALPTQLEGGQPDRGNELAARELGQHPRVDLVGLARQGREALDLDRVCDLDFPAAALERVVHEAGAVHRLDRRAHLDDPVIAFDTTREGHQAIGIRGAAPIPTRSPSSVSRQ